MLLFHLTIVITATIVASVLSTMQAGGQIIGTLFAIALKYHNVIDRNMGNKEKTPFDDGGRLLLTCFTAMLLDISQIGMRISIADGEGDEDLTTSFAILDQLRDEFDRFLAAYPQIHVTILWIDDLSMQCIDGTGQKRLCFAAATLESYPTDPVYIAAALGVQIEVP